MKPYNERLTLIDEAIESVDGDIERIKDYRKTDTHINYTVELGFFSVDSQWIFQGETICTHDEFIQRAKELGWCNGYKYGVEYKTNGKKPDLPSDTKLYIDFMGDGMYIASGVITLWGGVKSFRIVDERYKPKDEAEPLIKFIADQMRILTPDGEYRDMRELIEEGLNKMHNNDWYKKGELPPHNTECEVKIEGQWLPTVVIGHYANEVVVVDPCVTIQRFFCTALNNIRPLRTETDKLVEQMADHLSGCELVLTGEQQKIICKHLTEAGYRKTKQMSEDEFIAQAPLLDLTEVFSPIQMRKLYRADCRFLDQGE